MSCELCETIDWEEGETHRFVKCKTCHVPMLVLKEHRQFTDFEKEMIQTLVVLTKRREIQGKKIRWEQRKEEIHGHCHFE